MWIKDPFVLLGTLDILNVVQMYTFSIYRNIKDQFINYKNFLRIDYNNIKNKMSREPKIDTSILQLVSGDVIKRWLNVAPCCQTKYAAVLAYVFGILAKQAAVNLLLMNVSSV